MHVMGAPKCDRVKAAGNHLHHHLVASTSLLVLSDWPNYIRTLSLSSSSP